MATAAAQLEIPRDILDSARLSLEELRIELAVHLFAQGRLGVGKAHELAGLSLWEFRQILASRRIPPHYELEDLADDAATLRDLGRL